MQALYDEMLNIVADTWTEEQRIIQQTTMEEYRRTQGPFDIGMAMYRVYTEKPDAESRATTLRRIQSRRREVIALVDKEIKPDEDLEAKLVEMRSTGFEYRKRLAMNPSIPSADEITRFLNEPIKQQFYEETLARRDEWPRVPQTLQCDLCEGTFDKKFFAEPFFWRICAREEDFRPRGWRWWYNPRCRECYVKGNRFHSYLDKKRDEREKERKKKEAERLKQNKHCSGCNKTLPVTKFYDGFPDFEHGVSAFCRPCQDELDAHKKSEMARGREITGIKCTLCGERKEEGEFGMNGKKRRSQCKKCVNARRRERYQGEKDN